MSRKNFGTIKVITGTITVYEVYLHTKEAAATYVYALRDEMHLFYWIGLYEFFIERAVTDFLAIGRKIVFLVELPVTGFALQCGPWRKC